MSIYLYGNAGRVVEREFPMGEAPKTVTVDGEELSRVYTSPTIAVSRDFRCEAQSLPTVHTMDPKLREAVPAHNKEGVPLFSSKREKDRFCAHSQRLLEKGEIDTAYEYGDAPSGVDVKKERIKKARLEAYERLAGPEPKIA